MFNPPWTGAGYVETQVDGLRSQMRGKAEGYEVRQALDRMARLERSFEELRSEVTGLRNQCERLQENQEQLMAVVATLSEIAAIC